MYAVSATNWWHEHVRSWSYVKLRGRLCKVVLRTSFSLDCVCNGLTCKDSLIPALVVKDLKSTFCLYGFKISFFKLSFETIYALISFVIVQKTVFEAGKETHMSLILLSSEAIWMWAIWVFPATRVTLYKYGLAGQLWEVAGVAQR